jgi:hypothetical protein
MKNSLVPRELLWKKSKMQSVVQKKNIAVWIGYAEGQRILKDNWTKAYCSFHFNGKGQGVLIIFDMQVKQVRMHYRSLQDAQKAAVRWFTKSRLAWLKYYYK